MNVRFISVNDNIDTFSKDFNKDKLMIAVRALMDYAYAEDISDKINSAFKSMREKGWFLGSVPPYGYLKSPEDKHKLIIDEESSVIVKQIFAWKLEGISLYEIAKRLNTSNIKSPRNYYYSIGVLKDHKSKNKVFWTGIAVKSILTNQAYIGNIAGGKTKHHFGEVQVQSEENQIIVENTHKPIISKTDFEKVKAILEESNKKYKSNLNKESKIEKPPVLFKGIIFCNHCNKPLKVDFYKRVHCYSSSYRCLKCNTYTDNNIYISFKEIEEIVFTVIKNHLKCIVDYKKIIERLNSNEENQEIIVEIKKELSKNKKELTVTKNKQSQIYLDFSDDLIIMIYLFFY